MGTSYHITLVADEGEHFEFDRDELQKTIDDELETINQLMSTYIDDSELMRFNDAPIDQWMELSEPLMEVLAISEDISERSSGAFDVTVGPLVNLWGFGPQMRPEEVPSDDELAQALALTGHDKLQLDVTRARRTAPIFVDLSAVAKGYGVDWLAEILQKRGFDHFMVEIGGEVRVAGVSPRGTPWRIAVEQPTSLGGSARLAVALQNKAIATSGDYRNYFEVDGVRYSHTIDSKTGRPITHNLASVTVIADTAAQADAWATALNVLGPEKALELANAEQLAVYMIVKDGDGFSDQHSVTFSQYAP
ncbi:FAD:protein FMN transferase [Gilvimarinus xylanilyticus]|uniref:FAD:protein FMN transferase n=1 Tax=Gilvimarinus xylanilyticus TaxID=2944139 RepID=A0A9X2KTI2_9GAMM|nr:FAD:protein FMN transferase [Gilvimarinus xylanilyticus]MCP8898798.1 FAD:protein FMN transferase [Gilvimarinus xylanilyticus]